MSNAAGETGGKENVSTLEQYTIEQIPLDQRHGRPRDLFTIWFTSNQMPLTIVTGALATVVFGLPLVSAMIAIVVGNLVGAIFMALHSAQGPKLGIPQMIQSRAQYGVLGSLLVVGISVFMYVGFFASNLILGGQSVNQLASSISVNWGIIICAIISLVVVVFGYDLIHFLNRWLAIAFTLVMIVTAVLVLRDMPSGSLSVGAFSWSGFVATAVVSGVLWQIAYAPYVSDYSRYMKPEDATGKVFWYSYWGVVLGSVAPMLLGALVGVASKEASQVAAIYQIALGFGWVIMLVFALGIIDTNVLNAYSGVLCTITVGQNFKTKWMPGAGARAVVAIVFVAICLWGALAYASSFLTSYLNFMLFLLYLLVPWTLINLIDFYLVAHGDYDVPALFSKDGGPYGRFNWGTIAIYVLGFVVQIPFASTTFYTGPVAKALNGADYAWLVAIVIVSPIYYVYATRRRASLGDVHTTTPLHAEPEPVEAEI
jgi:NCS1 family nucleobase:cation symporter-1